MAQQWDLHAVTELLEKFASTDLASLTITDGPFSLSLEAKGAPPKTQPGETAPRPVPKGLASEPALQEPVPKGPASEAKADLEGKIVRSPLVGTFYAAAAPDQPPFVQPGSRVKKGDVLFVIESMKLMNEIQSDCDGEVTQILVENAQGVEYNQPVLVIK